MPAGPARPPLRIRPAGQTPAPPESARPPLTPAGMGLIAALVLLCAAIGWNMLTSAMADRLAGTDPAAALRWRPDHAGALSRLAESKLSAQPGVAADLARRALARDPLDVRAIRVLGLAAERMGDAARADRLMANAGLRSRRDIPTQLWILDHASRKGDFAEAYARADAVMRDEPTIASRVYARVIELARRPGGIEPLADRLAQDPPWRQGFIQTWIRFAGDPGLPMALLTAAEAKGAPATPAERQAMMTRLVRDGSFQQAFVFWVQGLSKTELTRLRDVNFGDFEDIPQAQSPFNWRIERQAEGLVDFAGAPQREGRALRLSLIGRPAPPVFVRQLLILPPGPSRLRGEVRADRFEMVLGLRWTIRCVGGPLVGESPVLLASTPWRRFEAPVLVPESGCDAQWLTLEPVGRNAGARRASGEVWYDNLEVTR